MNLTHTDGYIAAERRRDFERQAEQYRLARQAQPEAQKQAWLQKILLLIINLVKLTLS